MGKRTIEPSKPPNTRCGAGFEIKVAAVWGFLGWERVGLACAMDAEGNLHEHDNYFTVNGEQSVSDVNISVPDLMRLCVEENDRHFADYDESLLRPRAMPGLARFELRFVRVTK